MKQKTQEIGFLRARFGNWFKRAATRGNPEVFFETIADAYLIPERSYHTFDGHIAFCIRELSRLPAGLTDDRGAVEIALFLHDAVIGSETGDDVKRSADFARDLLREMGADEAFTRRVYAHILATGHDTEPGDPNSRLTVDIDLSILGQPEDIFDAYDRAIREEYAFLPEDRYRAGRKAVLETFLGRPRLYLTDHFRDRYERQARKNLVRALGRL